MTACGGTTPAGPSCPPSSPRQRRSPPAASKGIAGAGGADVGADATVGAAEPNGTRRRVGVGGVGVGGVGVGVEEVESDSKFSIDDGGDEDSPDSSPSDAPPHPRRHRDLHEDVGGGKASPVAVVGGGNGGGGGGDVPPAFGDPLSGGGSGGKNNHGSVGGMTAFESMYHLSPETAWRLRSAYSPRTPRESHLDDIGSEILAHRHPGKADAIMRGLGVARESESRAREWLGRIGDAIGSCERLRESR